MLKDGRPTILDVAERAGVSVGTVSNVLNGTTPVSTRRRRRVLQAIDELSYSRNLLAQGLRRRRSQVVGVCVPHTSVSYFAKLADAFEEVVSSRGFEIIQILSHDDPEVEHRRVSSLLNYHVGGIILLPSPHPQRTLDAVAKSGTPLVVVDRPLPHDRFDQVTFDNRMAMLDAARQLIAHGHRRIVFVVRFGDLSTTRQRVNALRTAARGARLGVTTTILECGSYDPEAVIAQLRDVMRAPDAPTAIIASNSRFAAIMLQAFEAFGIRCPQDISLLAFDQPEWAALVTPKLSVVQQPIVEVARKAWEFLLHRMDNKSAPLQKAELQATVIIGSSVAAPRTRKLRLLPDRSQAARTVDAPDA
jgi:LacI family transcriptional regulator